MDRNRADGVRACSTESSLFPARSPVPIIHAHGGSYRAERREARGCFLLVNTATEKPPCRHTQLTQLCPHKGRRRQKQAISRRRRPGR